MRTVGCEKTGQGNLIGKRTISMIDILIDQIVEVNIEDIYLTDPPPDIKNIDPIVFYMVDYTHGKVGDHVGRAYRERF
jgi:hypothetical protein